MKFAIVAVALLFAASPAFAGKKKCKDVTIKVQNQPVDDIKVVDIEYHDSTIKDWRKENGVRAKTAKKNYGWISPAYERDLEEVKNNTVKVRVKYKLNKLGKWKDPTWSSPSSSANCTQGTVYTVYAKSTD